jgi:hypothetical protein
MCPETGMKWGFRNETNILIKDKHATMFALYTKHIISEGRYNWSE